ncbi:MAG: phosphatase PAP2 family protein [Clostridiales bacterium]|nr:phosphatase PAP2 family protein [Clostridiales bacterium]
MQRLKLVIKSFVQEHPHVWWSLYVPVYLLMYFTIEKVVKGPYWYTQLPIDYQIPFVEEFVIFYDIWFFYLVAVGVYLILKDGEGFRRYMWYIMIGYTVSTLICALVPNAQALRPDVMPRHNVFTFFVQCIYNADTNTNVFPSVHVVGAIGGLIAVWRTKGLRRWYWRAGVTVLASLIMAATLLIKQHALIDLIAGVAVSIITAVIVYVFLDRVRKKKLAQQAPDGEKAKEEPV